MIDETAIRLRYEALLLGAERVRPSPICFGGSVVLRAQTHRAVETLDAVVEPPSIDAHQTERVIAAVVVGTDRDRLLGELQRRDLEGC
jgi:hypothetical protein